MAYNKPSYIEYGKFRFLIIDAPNEANLDSYIKEFKTHRVTDVVRACQPTYSIERVEKSGVKVHDMAFTDGDPPPAEIIDKFLKLCDDRFTDKSTGDNAIAVHCVAGLGRAPVLVAVSLIDAGLEPLEAVQKIREKRRGAINARQLSFLEDEYKRRPKGCCTIM